MYGNSFATPEAHGANQEPEAEEPGAVIPDWPDTDSDSDRGARSLESMRNPRTATRSNVGVPVFFAVPESVTPSSTAPSSPLQQPLQQLQQQEWFQQQFHQPSSPHTQHAQQPQQRQVQVEAEEAPQDQAEEAPQDPEVVLFREPIQTLWSEETPAGSNIYWEVGAAKLKTTDRVAVSPPFDIGTVGPFRLMLSPKVVSERKGGQSFKKAMGRGYIRLKCEAPQEAGHDISVTFKMVVGGGEEPQEQNMTMHNFAESGVCCLPKEETFDEWDWMKAVDEATGTFIVRLEIH